MLTINNHDGDEGRVGRAKNSILGDAQSGSWELSDGNFLCIPELGQCRCDSARHVSEELLRWGG